MKNHQLKTHSRYFEEVWNKRKLFEIRLNDRNFEIGDSVTLLEYDEILKVFLKRTIHAEISYILKGGSFGIENDYCILSLNKLKNYKLDENGLPKFSEL